jgi:hypothetical protein
MRSITGCFNKKRINMAIEKFDGEALVVRHSSIPPHTNTSNPITKPVFQNTWQYRTEVQNISDRKLKIVWFEGYLEDNEYWVGCNILNKTLRNETFRDWYKNEQDKGVENEWMIPGEIRVCNRNWHASEDSKGCRVKWAFIAIDEYGNDYYAESIVEMEQLVNT